MAAMAINIKGEQVLYRAIESFRFNRANVLVIRTTSGKEHNTGHKVARAAQKKATTNLLKCIHAADSYLIGPV